MSISMRWKVKLLTDSGKGIGIFSPSRFCHNGLRIAMEWNCQLKTDAIKIGEDFVGKRTGENVRRAEITPRWGKGKEVTVC